jgi:hypothetical protein
MMLDRRSSDAPGTELAMNGARITAVGASDAECNTNFREDSKVGALGHKSNGKNAEGNRLNDVCCGSKELRPRGVAGARTAKRSMC